MLQPSKPIILFQVFQCSGEDMNLVLTGGVTPATSPKVLSPGTLMSPPPQAPAPRLLAQHIAHQSLLARQHENLLLASLRPPMLPMMPTYTSLRAPSPQYTVPLQVLPTKRSYERAFTPEASPAKRQYMPQMQVPPSLPMLSYGTSAPIFSYANSSPMLSTYASSYSLAGGMPTGLPAGYGALSAAMPGSMASMGSPFPLSMFPTYPYYPGV